ncbi:hypothetical protein AURDEDRAFT_129118 [Auricularia subglabra TFB-10046 SS5]|uniref:Uncharacterized protein n=1 Tax=Auricularia subglabra (strain TFB-10046 / SS5) TaxID=717982 RepID=J0WWP4_AURST|nr:hypothetical protein AURDEDRAFT_129118 [Auricularia subglabra TFB-10046 SS5]
MAPHQDTDGSADAPTTQSAGPMNNSSADRIIAWLVENAPEASSPRHLMDIIASELCPPSVRPPAEGLEEDVSDEEMVDQMLPVVGYIYSVDDRETTLRSERRAGIPRGYTPPIRLPSSVQYPQTPEPDFGGALPDEGRDQGLDFSPRSASPVDLDNGLNEASFNPLQVGATAIREGGTADPTSGSGSVSAGADQGSHARDAPLDSPAQARGSNSTQDTSGASLTFVIPFEGPIVPAQFEGKLRVARVEAPNETYRPVMVAQARVE